MSTSNSDARSLLQQGSLDEALATLKSEVQADPADAKHRVFLFQLLSVFGKWDSAHKQLEVAGDLDPGNLAMVQAYREAIRCEEQRNLVFTGKASPTILGEPAPWLACLIESLRLHAGGNFSESAGLRSEAFEQAPATAGQLTLADESTSEFQWLADADPRLGPVLEVILNGQYYWVPIDRIARIDFEAPADLRDFVWTPVHLTLATGMQTVAMIPTRYFGSESVSDAAIRLARKTDWTSAHGDEAQFGLGQRMFATDVDDYPLLELCQLTFDVQPETADDESLTEVHDEAPALSSASIGLASNLTSASDGG
ncbi:MAG: type VI secretion system accessory protein TagJ [Planctomycetota bacterium]